MEPNEFCWLGLFRYKRTSTRSHPKGRGGTKRVLLDVLFRCEHTSTCSHPKGGVEPSEFGWLCCSDISMRSPEGRGGTKRVFLLWVVQITVSMHPHSHPKAGATQREFCWLGLFRYKRTSACSHEGRAGDGGGGGVGGGLKPSWFAGLGSCGLNCAEVTLGIRRDTQVKCATGVRIIVFVLFVCFVSRPWITVTVDWALHTNVCVCVCVCVCLCMCVCVSVCVIIPYGPVTGNLL